MMEDIRNKPETRRALAYWQYFRVTINAYRTFVISKEEFAVVWGAIRRASGLAGTGEARDERS